MKMKLKKKQWYKLDQVGHFYSFLGDIISQNIFRYSANIKDDIDVSVLQESFEETMKEYPLFNVTLRRGMFWYYLEETTEKYRIYEDEPPFCNFKMFDQNHPFLFRITYYKKRINFEVSHILSDGRGSLDFFKKLVSRYVIKYYKLEGIDVNSNDEPYFKKAEDSFLKNYKESGGYINNVDKVYHYKAPKYKNLTRYLEGHVNVNKILDLAHKNNVTLTVLIISVYIYAFKDVLSDKDLKKSIIIDVPVDLRHYFNSKSVRNFFTLTHVSYKFKSREDTLQDIMKEIDVQLKDILIKENLERRVNQLTKLEKNIFCRLAPLPIKTVIMKIADIVARSMSTSCVSNIGIIKLDPKVEEYVLGINTLVSTPYFQILLCTYKDDLCLGMSTVYKNNEVLKNFCRWFTDQGIEITMNVSEGK